jgi:hypothetical protein
MASVAEILDAAADLIEPEGAWTQKANARDAGGEKVSALGSAATCFCMAGALIRASGGEYPKTFVEAVLPEPSSPYHDWLVAFNDAPGRTQAEVVAKLREAAAAARAVED